MELKTIPLSLIDPPEQTVRVEISEEALEDLAQSIRQVGLINPITVRATGERYEVVAGHRRWMAANLARLAAVRVFVLDEEQGLASALKVHENVFREEISPIEEAAFYMELLETVGKDTNQLADLVRRPRTHVEGRLALLSLDTRILHALSEKRINLGVAEELGKLHKEFDRGYYLQWAIVQGATKRNVHEWVMRANIQADCEAGVTPVMPSVGAATLAEYAGPVCYLCGEAEPLDDVEFWYIHRGCKRVAEKMERARAGGRNGEPGLSRDSSPSEVDPGAG